jgi:hypothetical protein
VRFLLGEVRDGVLVENEDLAAIRQRLADERDGDDALQLALFVLDGDLSDGAREEAAEALEELLDREVVLHFVEGALYACPTPPSADLAGARRLVRRVGAEAVARMLDALADGRTVMAIEDVWRAWEALPPSLFAGEDERVRTRAAFVRTGLFWILVAARRSGQSVDGVVAAALQMPAVRAVRGHRGILETWLAPLRAPVAHLRSKLETPNVYAAGAAISLRGAGGYIIVNRSRVAADLALRERRRGRAPHVGGFESKLRKKTAGKVFEKYLRTVGATGAVKATRSAHDRGPSSRDWTALIAPLGARRFIGDVVSARRAATDEQAWWDSVALSSEERRVFTALSDTRFKLRTLTGVARASGLSVGEVLQILERYPKLVRKIMSARDAYFYMLVRRAGDL